MNGLLLALVLSLNGSWNFHFAEGQSAPSVASPDFVATDTMVVPGCYDALPKWFMKRGTGLYRRTFALEQDVPAAWLVIDGLGLYGRFWIDGREIGVDDLPWSRVELATGPLAAGEHTIVAAVDNRFDWSYQKLIRPYYNFQCWGGFHHGLSLVTDVRKLFVRTRDYAKGEIEVEIVEGEKVKGGGQGQGQGGGQGEEWRLVFDGKNEVKATFRNGRATVRVPDFKLWSPESPNLHTVSLRVSSSNPTIKQSNNQTILSARFGLRTIEAKNRGLYLNGKRIFLKGANRHEQLLQLGASTPEGVMLADLQNLKDMGGNFIRGAHYSQSQRFLDLCDEMGVLVWEESLGWGNGKKYNRLDGVNEMLEPGFVDGQVRQTRLMVRNSFNHPSVIIFAFLNEFGSNIASNKALADRLIDTIRAEDSGRLVTYACSCIDGDLANEKTDIIAFNTYPGTIEGYPGLADELKEKMRNMPKSGINWVTDYFRKRYPEKTLIMSEIGVGAIYGHHDPSAPFYTEEFQTEYNANAAEIVYENPDIAGLAFWQLYDTRSNYRDCGIDGKKRREAMSYAGLFTADRRPKQCVRTLATWFKEKTPANLK